MLKHGWFGTRLYEVWAGMKRRCYNPKGKAYRRYGGRGILVCDEWQSFEPFKEWALSSGYGPGLTIDRINNDAGYSPGNCRWATASVQMNNKGDNRMITYRDKTMNLSQWAISLGMDRRTLRARLDKLGWAVERAFNEPVAHELGRRSC